MRPYTYEQICKFSESEVTRVVLVTEGDFDGYMPAILDFYEEEHDFVAVVGAGKCNELHASDYGARWLAYPCTKPRILEVNE